MSNLHINSRYMELFFSIILILLINLSTLFSQENFLLNETDLVGFELKRQYDNLWIVGNDNQTTEIISQDWLAVGASDEQIFIIAYCEFNSENEAIRGIAYASNSYARPYIWGSFNAAILGDLSWIAIEGKAIFFVRGNIGINIFKHKFVTTDKETLSGIAYKIINKIEANVKTRVVCLLALNVRCIFCLFFSVKFTDIDTDKRTAVICPFCSSAHHHCSTVRKPFGIPCS